MSQQGNAGVNQSGSVSLDTRTRPARNGKRSRDQNEEPMQLAASGMAGQCIKARDLDCSSPSGGSGGENGTDSHIFAVPEKRVKSGPTNNENVDTVAASGIEEATQFRCDICCVTSTSAKDLNTHLSGKKHAKRAAKLSTPRESQGLMENTSAFSNASSQALMENASKYLNANMGITSLGQQVVLENLHNNLSQESRGHVSSCAGGTDVELMNSQASLSKCPDLNDANGVAVAQQPSIDVPFTGTVNQVLKNDSSSRPALDDGHVTNETLHSPLAPAGDFLKESNKRVDDGHVTNVSVDVPFTETVNQVLMKNECSSRPTLDGHVTNETIHSPAPADDFSKESNKQVDGHVTNGTVHYPDEFLKEINKRTIFEGQPIKSVLASLNTRSNSDCVARALASTLSAYACPGLEDLQRDAFCGQQAAGCSDSQAAGAMSADSHGMVKMHAQCFLNLLHDVRVSAFEDLFRHVVGEQRNGGLAMKTWLPNAAPVSGLACDGESADLNCAVCRVEYGSKADLDLHLAGKRHTSLVRRLGSRCQLCNLNCSSERDFETHLSGRKHASKLRLLRKRVTF